MHPVSSTSNQRNVWRGAGLCETCGRVQTHEKLLFGYARRRLTVKDLVFEGICLRCNTIMSAKLQRNKPINHTDGLSAGIRRTTQGEPINRRGGKTGEGIGRIVEGLPDGISYTNDDDDVTAITTSLDRDDSPGMRDENEKDLDQIQEEEERGDSRSRNEEEDGRESPGAPGHARNLDKNNDDVGEMRANSYNISTLPGVQWDGGVAYTSILARKKAGLYDVQGGANDDVGEIRANSDNISTLPGVQRDDGVAYTSIFARKKAGLYDVQGGASEDDGEIRANSYNISTLPGVQRDDGVAYTSILARKKAGVYDVQRDRNEESPGALGQPRNLDNTTVDDRQIGANSNNINTLPGVQRGGGVDYKSLLARKEAGVYAARGAAGHIDALMHKKNATLSLISDCTSCCDVLDILKQNSNLADEDILIKALRKIRDILPIMQGMIGNHILKKEWPRTFAAIGSPIHSSSANAQAELLHTLWSIVSLNQRYISDLRSGVEMKDIIRVMEIHSNHYSVQKYGCGLLAYISSCKKCALDLLGDRDGNVVQMLMDIMKTPSNEGHFQGNALKALFRLSSASLSSDTPSKFFQMVCCAQGNIHGGNSLANAMHTIMHTMQRNPKDTTLQINGLRLLWNILESDIAVGDDRCDFILGKILQHTLAVKAHHQKSQAFHETMICTVSKMSCYGPNSFGEQPIPLFVVETMLAHPTSSIVALYGCRCIANICAQSPSSELFQHVIASSNGILAIIVCMDTFQEHRIVQSEACTALHAICNNSPQNKEQVWRLGGVDRIFRAYNSYCWSEEMSTTTKIRACVAINTLLYDCRVVSDDLRNKGIILKFEEEYSDATVSGELRQVIQDLLASETCECLRDIMTEITTCSISENNSIGSNSRLPTAVKAMKRFPTYANIHEMGCKLIACIFASSSANDAGDLQYYETIILSLKEHSDTPENVAAACSALRNMCLFQMSYAQNPSDISMKSYASEVFNSMALHEDNVSILEHASGALWAFFCAQNSNVLSCVTDNTISTIVRAMNRFPGCSHLQRNGIGIFWAVFSVSGRGSDFVTDDLVSMVVRFVGERESDAADMISAIDIVLALTSMGFQALEILLKNEMLIYSIVGCMRRYPHSPSIQGASIDVLSNIAVNHDIKTEIFQSGGTDRIIFALGTLQQDRTVVCKAFAALANLVSAANAKILRANNATTVMIDAMKAHQQIVSIQIGAASTLWALASSAAFFQDDIASLGGVEAVAEAMARFVTSEQMQSKGLCFVWSLAIPKHLKKRVGWCAIEPVVNGLSAHISVEKICSDGLGCIKTLALNPSNRGLLEECGIFELIHACLW